MTDQHPFGPIIHSYSRAEALSDGVLIDVSQLAREAGLKWPVALTAIVWQLIQQIPEQFSHQDVTGRLWDVLWMARLAIHKSDGQTTELIYQIILPTGENTSPDEIYSQVEEKLTTLKMVAGPGDNLEPVLTIMLPNED